MKKAANRHNKNFREILALITLQKLFPDEFCDLHLSDRPDLMDFQKGLGIEVTYPTDKKREQLSSYYYSHLEGQKIQDASEKGLKKFRDASLDILLDENDRISGYKSPLIPFDLTTLYAAIDNKVEKLNRGLYAYPTNIFLYLEMSKYSYDISQYDVAQKILKYADTLRNKNTYFFKEIFYDCLFILYRINLENKKIQEYDLRDLSEEIFQEYDKRLLKGDGYDQL